MHASYADRQNHRTSNDSSRVTRQTRLPRLLCKLSLSSLSLRILVAAVAGCAWLNAHAWDAPALAAPEAARLAGPWAVAQALNAERMGAAPLDKTEFILDDVALKQHRKFAEYSGDISGRWIGAAAFLAPQFPKPFAAFPEVMAGFPLYQKRDGHFGADQHLPAIERKNDMPILWGNGRLLIGLVEVYDRTGDTNALALAKRMGDYFIATDPVYDKPENLRTVGGNYADGFVTCYFSCVEGIVGLARVTKDQRYLDEAIRIAALAATVTNFDGIHSHGRLCTARGFADLYALTGERRWRDAAERDWRIFADRHLLPTGGVKEMLEAKCVRDEGCAEADWLRLNLSLWRLTGEGRYLDAAERSLKNHFIYQQFPNGGSGHRSLHQVGGQPVAFKGLSEEAWWCCGEHWARAMVEVARTAVTSSPRGLFISLAIDCDATVAGPGGNWKTALRETADGFTIRLEPTKPVKAEVRIHRLNLRSPGAPDESVEAPKGLKVRKEPDAWIISGIWRGVQELRVHLPLALQVETAADGSGILLRGYDILAVHGVPANAWLTGQLPATRPVILWSAALPVTSGHIVVPASLTPNADPDRPEQWRPLELAPLRAQGATRQSQVAWFSFQPRPASPERIAALLGSQRQSR
jgi:hypothetical protein